MTAAELLTDLQRQGFSLTPLPEGKLAVRPAGKLTDILRVQLRQRKAEVLVLLAQKTAPDYRKLYAAMPRQVPEDMPLVDSWLADAHPALWRKIRDLDDELIHLEQRGVPEAAYQTKLNELVAVCQGAKALREGRWGGLLVKSELLGTEVWVIKDEAALALVKANDQPIFFADEIALLKGKAPEQIKDILKAKAVFPGCRVVQ